MTIEIDPIAFYIPLPFFGWWPIYWYGISWLVAILSINYFARLGANLSAKTDSRYLKQAFSVLIIIAALRVFYITFV